MIKSSEIPLPGLHLKSRLVSPEVSGPALPGHSEAADVWETLELLWEVVLVEHRVCTVLHHLQRHRAKHRGKLVDALGPEEAQHR